MLQRLPALVLTDTRLMLRDGFLFAIGLLYLGFAVILRLSLPALNELAAAALNIDLRQSYPALLAFVVFFEGAVPAGVIVGFLLIEEQDQHTLDALLVTPLPIGAFLLYRLGSAYLLACVLMVSAYLLIGTALIPISQLLTVTAVGALNGPLIALTVAALANNKIEGFAVLKSVNLIGLPILIAWFVNPQWHWLLWPFPSYWTAVAAWASTPAAALPAAATALVLSVGVLGGLYRSYRRKVDAGCAAASN
jgi:fluoroquinolone transport system permease protein